MWKLYLNKTLKHYLEIPKVTRTYVILIKLITIIQMSSLTKLTQNNNLFPIIIMSWDCFPPTTQVYSILYTEIPTGKSNQDIDIITFPKINAIWNNEVKMKNKT